MQFKDIVMIGSIVIGVIFFILILHNEKKKRKILQSQFEELKEDVRHSKRNADLVKQINRLKDMSDSIIEQMNDDVEDRLSRMSNNKIIEFEEYAKETLEKISINHKEVMFLYDMLNDKEESVKATIEKLNELKNEVTELIHDNKDKFVKKELQNDVKGIFVENNIHSDRNIINNVVESVCKDSNAINNVVNSKDSSIEDKDVIACKDDFIDLLKCINQYEDDVMGDNSIKDDKESIDEEEKLISTSQVDEIGIKQALEISNDDNLDYKNVMKK